MAVVKDWTLDAAEEIFNNLDEINLIEEHRKGTVPWIKGIIVQHCPFKPDVAYMPVPRCETCAHWDNLATENKHHGACRLYEHDVYAPVSFSRMVTTENFGCVRWKEK